VQQCGNTIQQVNRSTPGAGDKTGIAWLLPLKADCR